MSTAIAQSKALIQEMKTFTFPCAWLVFAFVSHPNVASANDISK